MEEKEAEEEAKKKGTVVDKPVIVTVECKDINNEALKRLMLSSEKKTVKGKYLVLWRENLGTGATKVALVFNEVPRTLDILETGYPESGYFDALKDAASWIKNVGNKKCAYEIRDSETRQKTYEKWVYSEARGWHTTQWDKFGKQFYCDPASIPKVRKIDLDNSFGSRGRNQVVWS
jgi:hypothetical protein